MWAKVHDSLTFHAKVLVAGNEAMGVWVRLLAWCAHQGTDGAFPESVALAVGPKRALDQLVASGLVEKSDAGYVFHDFLDHQPGSERIRAERERKARNVATFRSRRGSSNRDVTEPVTGYMPVTLPLTSGPVTTEEEEKEEEKELPPPVLRTDPPSGGPKKRDRPAGSSGPKPDLADEELTAREKLIRDAIVGDETLSPIVPAPNRLSRDLLAVAPGVDVPREVKAAGAWIRANPERAKSAGGRYLLNWLKRAQDNRGGRTAYTTPGYRSQPTIPEGTGWKARAAESATQAVEMSDDDIPY